MDNLSVRRPVQQPAPGNSDAQESWPRWQQPIGASAPSTAPPTYELYREKEGYHQGAPKIVSGKAGGVASGCLPSTRASYAETSTGLTPLSNPYPPEDWKAAHGCGPPLYFSPMRTSVGTSIGPPLYLPNGRWDQSSTLQNQIAGQSSSLLHDLKMQESHHCLMLMMHHLLQGFISLHQCYLITV